MGAVIDLPEGAGDWVLAMGSERFCLTLEDSAVPARPDGTPSGVLLGWTTDQTGRGGFRLAVSELPQVTIALETAASLAFGRADVDSDGVWTIRLSESGTEVDVEGPVETAIEGADPEPTGTIDMPYAGLHELYDKLAAIAGCRAR